MKRTFNTSEKLLSFLYILGLLAMISIIASIIITRKEPVRDAKVETFQDITTSWTLDRDGTQAVEVKKLGEYMDAESGILSIYYQLPELDTDTSLVYRSKDVYTKVLVDEEVIYETSVHESPLYNKSPGNLWNILYINSEYSGKLLELQIYMVYDTNSITVDSLFIGDKADIILGLFADNLSGIFISMVLALLGIVLVVVDLLPSYGRTKKHHGLFWVGIYSTVGGVWGMIETNLLQFCFDDMRILQLLDNMLIILPTVPLLLYLHTEYNALKNKLMFLMTAIGVGYILICAYIQCEGTKDFHHMLNGGLYIMVITDFVMCTWLFIHFIKLKIAKKPSLNCFCMFMGLFSCCSCTVFEVFRSLSVDRIDRAVLIRVGMLMLCIFFAIGSQIETYKIVEQGLKYELISKLAYSDGLTGLGNRTAYLEELETYANNTKENTYLGVVYLDVNNLKTVNDKLGHEFGDELIKAAAKIIENSFGTLGKSYRIGGDEFCVLIPGIDLQEKYDNALDIFNNLIHETNNQKKYTYNIQIAHGFAICKELTRANIEDTIADADSIMYQNKTALKNNA